MSLSVLQQTSGFGAFGVTSVALPAFGSNVTVGSVIWVVTNVAQGSTLPVPIDSQSNTYTLIDSCNNGAGDAITGQYWAKITTGGPLTVTITGGGSSDYAAGYAAEISNASTLSGSSALNSNPGTGANAAVSGTASITDATPGIILAFNVDCNANAAGAAGTSPIAFTALGNVWSGYVGGPAIGGPEWAALPSSPSTVQATAADTTFSHHNMVMAVFTGPPPLVVTTQPTDQTVNSGGTATFTAAGTTGSGSVSYQWQDNSTGSFANISGATSSTYSPSAATYSMNNRQYQCVLTDSLTSLTTNTAQLHVAFQTSGTPSTRVLPGLGLPFGSGPFGLYSKPAPSTGEGVVKTWSGSAWVSGKPVKEWSGSAWVVKPLKIWNSTTSSWITCT